MKYLHLILLLLIVSACAGVAPLDSIESSTVESREPASPLRTVSSVPDEPIYPVVSPMDDLCGTRWVMTGTIVDGQPIDFSAISPVEMEFYHPHNEVSGNFEGYEGDLGIGITHRCDDTRRKGAGGHILFLPDNGYTFPDGMEVQDYWCPTSDEHNRYVEVEYRTDKYSLNEDMTRFYFFGGGVLIEWERLPDGECD